MFGLVKPAHVQMRSALPPGLARDFDEVLDTIQEAVPSWYEKGSRDRAVAIVMGGWIEDRIVNGDFSLPQAMRAKASHLVGLAERFNERDVRGDGHAATRAARDILRALRDV